MPLGRGDLVLCSGTLPRDVSFRDRVDAAAAAQRAGDATRSVLEAAR